MWSEHSSAAVARSLFLCMVLLIGPKLLSAVPLSSFYPYGPSAGDTTLHRNDDDTSPAIPLPSPFNYFANSPTSLYVGNNGVISFDSPVVAFTPESLPISGGRVLLSPYWGDVDTRPANGGAVYYRNSTDSTLLNMAGNQIRAVFPADFSTFTPTFLFIATWDHVGYYNSKTDKTNTFQCILISDGPFTFVMFLYADGLIQWTTGDASDGINGFGGTPAQGGFNAGDGVRFFSIPGSQTADIINIATTSNIGIPGMWIFRVDLSMITVAEPICMPECDHGTCVSPQECECDAGYTGDRCRLDIVECADESNGGCEHNCTNTVGSFLCSCRDGFTLNSNQRTCDDVDECLVNNGGCADVCINTIGLFQCSCDSGYEFEKLPEDAVPEPTNAGRACIDIDECMSNNGGCGQVCSNTIGSFECSCYNSGYELARDGRECADVDECTTGQHNCTGIAQCVNEIGSFYCTCPDGYRLDSSQVSCLDIDECAEETSQCSQECSNTIGSFICSCVDGYTLDIDGRKCNDIDECEAENMGGCQYICVNTEGSYYCDCPMGFFLTDDERTCSAKLCPTLSDPLNGSISCFPSGNQTTGVICTLGCDGGFQREGSATRACRGDSWTGTPVTCNPYQCEQLDAPTNGAILFPCEQDFGTSCTILCTFGHRLEGSSQQSCALLEGSTTDVEWTDPPMCIESNPCDPNPCMNQGRCIKKALVELNDQPFECNCARTGYEGATCQIGIITVPAIPTIETNNVYKLEISARPLTNITVNIQGDSAITVSPSSVILSQSNPRADINVTGLSLGQYSLHYTLAGPEADSFDTPEDSRIFVSPRKRSPGKVNAYFQAVNNEVGFLNESCCMSTFTYPECPMTTDTVTFSSTCLWTARNTVHTTSGIVFAQFKMLSIPISISGIQIEYESGTIDTSVLEFGSCTACEANSNNLLSSDQHQAPDGPENCYHYPIDAGDTLDFLTSYALANTYIERISPLLPSWIGIRLLKPTSRNTPSFNDGDFSTSLAEQDGVADIERCAHIRPDSPGLYSVLRYAGSYDIQLRVYDEVQSHETDGQRICVAINLCEEMLSPVYVQLPRMVQNTISQLALLKPYRDADWSFSLDTVSFYPIRKSVEIAGEYWNGTSMYTPHFPGANLEIGSLVYPSLSSSKEEYVRIKADSLGGLGTLSLHVENSENHRGIFTGGLSVEFNIDIEDDFHSLTLISSSPVVMFTSETSNICNHGASLLTKYIPRADQEFFSELFSLSEVTPECDMPLFIAFDHSLTFHGMSLHLNTGCPRLRLDRLIFPQMTHTLYFTESDDFRSQCVFKEDVGLDVSDPVLMIRSTLRQVNRLPLGAILTVLPDEDSLALSADFPPEKDIRKAKLHSVDVSVLGTVINTPIYIDEGTLSFTANADLYDTYPATLTVSASTDVPWERIVFTVDGDMTAETVQTMDEYVKDYIIEEIINKTLERESNARQAVMRANQTLNVLTTRLRMLEIRLSEATENFEREYEASRAANETLRNATAGVDTANTDIGEAQNALNEVCQESSCMDVEVRREVCQTCYQDILTEEAGLCTILRPITPDPILDVVVGYTTQGRWQYVQVCQDVCSRICDWFTSYTRCNRECRGVCVYREFMEPVIERVQQPALEFETVPCDPPKLVFSETITATCCESYIEQSPNVECREMCRSAQVQATERLREVNSETAEVFERVNRARQTVLAANARLARARVQRDNIQLMRDELRNNAYRNALFVIDQSLVNQQSVLSEISDELKIVRQYETVGIEQISVIKRVQFTTDISSESPTILPLTFLWSSFGRELSLSIPFDFTASYELNLRQVAIEITSLILNTTSQTEKRSTSRFRRQDGSDSEIRERSRNREAFQENCVLIANVAQYIQNTLTSLEIVYSNISTARDRLQRSKEDLLSQARSNGTNSGVNTLVDFDALQELFNITRDDFRDDSDQEIIDNYRNFFNDLADATEEIMNSVDETSFGEWQASMEMLHNQTGSAAGYPCTGFADCLDTIADLIRRLIADLRPGEDKQALQQQLAENRPKFIQLATSMTLKIPDGIEVVTDMLDIVNAEILLTYWCSSVPIITEQPPMQLNVSSGIDLTIQCPYESSLQASAQWRKDGAPIPASNSSTLIVSNVNIMDSGNYTCHISNAVGMESSLNVSVLVYELPEFFQVLNPVTTYAGNESGAWFSCNASAWPYPGWRWYYRAQESDPWIQFEGEDTNELTVSSPQKDDEGWYTCEAFNYHGYIRAPPVRLTVLPVSIAQLALVVEFTLIHDSDQTCANLTLLQEEIEQYMHDEIKIGSASIASIEIVTSTATLYDVSLTFISKNVTTGDTRRMVLREIENEALPSRGSVIQARRSLQQAVLAGEVSFDCEDIALSLQANTLTFQTPKYICPPGQELHTNFLLCVGCPRGTYQAVRTGERVINGEGIKEQYPVCQPCPVSSYQDELASTECKLCPEYHQTVGPSSTSRNDCYVDPLLVVCQAGGSSSQVKVDCQINRPAVEILCSFDGGLQHECKLPLIINIQSGLSVGNHSVVVSARDSLGLTAATTVKYSLEEEEQTQQNLRPVVPRIAIQFVNDSPRVEGDSVEIDFVLSRPTTTVTCQLNRGEHLNCSSGSVSYTNLAPGRYSFRVAAGESREEKGIERRNFEIPSGVNYCTTHLINRGITIGFGGMVKVEFASVGPATEFLCRLDRQTRFSCNSPVELTVEEGAHTLKVTPLECDRRRTQSFKFTV